MPVCLLPDLPNLPNRREGTRHDTTELAANGERTWILPSHAQDLRPSVKQFLHAFHRLTLMGFRWSKKMGITCFLSPWPSYPPNDRISHSTPWGITRSPGGGRNRKSDPRARIDRLFAFGTKISPSGVVLLENLISIPGNSAKQSPPGRPGEFPGIDMPFI